MSDVTIRCRACNKSFQFQRQTGDFTVECPHCLRQLKIKSKSEGKNAAPAEPNSRKQGPNSDVLTSADVLPNVPRARPIAQSDPTSSADSSDSPVIDSTSKTSVPATSDLDLAEVVPEIGVYVDGSKINWKVVVVTGAVILLVLLVVFFVVRLNREPDTAAGWVRLLEIGNSAKHEKAMAELKTIDDPDSAIPKLLTNSEAAVRASAIELILARGDADANSTQSLLDCWIAFPDSRDSVENALSTIGIPTVRLTIEFHISKLSFSEATVFDVLSNIEEDIAPALAKILVDETAAGKNLAIKFLKAHPEKTVNFVGKQLRGQRVARLPETMAILSLEDDPGAVVYEHLNQIVDDPVQELDLVFWKRLIGSIGDNEVDSLVSLSEREEPKAWKVGLEGLRVFAAGNPAAVKQLARVSMFAPIEKKQQLATSLLKGLPTELVVKAIVSASSVEWQEKEGFAAKINQHLVKEFETKLVAEVLAELLKGTDQVEVLFVIELLVNLGDEAKSAHAALESLANTNVIMVKKAVVIALTKLDPAAIKRLGLEGFGYPVYLKSHDADYNPADGFIKFELVSMEGLPDNLRDVNVHVLFVRNSSGLPAIMKMEEFSFSGNANVLHQGGNTYVQSTLEGKNASNGGFYLRIRGNSVAELLKSGGSKSFGFVPTRNSAMPGSVVDFSEPGKLYFAFSIDSADKKQDVLSNTLLLETK